MSNKSENIIKSFYIALGDGNLQLIEELFSDTIEWTEMSGFPYGGVYNGMSEITENVFSKLGEEWEGFGVDINEYVVSGVRVVAHGHYHGTFKNSGKSMKVAVVHSWTIEGDKIQKFEQYTDTYLVRNAMQ